MAEKMRAVRYHEYGDSGKLTLESVPRPAPKAGEVLVRVHYSKHRAACHDRRHVCCR